MSLPQNEVVRLHVEHAETDPTWARLAAVEAIARDVVGRDGVDAVDYEAMQERALKAREAVRVQAVREDGSHDISRKQATVVAVAVTVFNILVNIIFHAL